MGALTPPTTTGNTRVRLPLLLSSCIGNGHPLLLTRVMVEQPVGRIGTLLSWPLYFLEVALHFLLGNTKRGKSVKYLKGNFRPVRREVQQEGLEVVEGELPADLSGCFLRIGPNPAHNPVGAYHWFDGDGLVHACRIKDGRASYANRWVHTKRFLEERALGWSSYTKLGDLSGFGGLVCLGLASLKKTLGVNVDGKGTGNTAMVYHAKRLLALHEGDMPYALKVACEGVVETVERVSFGKLKAFTAHPKIDQSTGHMHFFGYDVREKPYCTYAVVDESGKLVKTAPIDIPRPVMMHDFAITANYSIFIDTPLVFNPEVMVKEGKIPFVFDEKKGIRFGLRPHSAAGDDVDAVQWFELPSQMIFHVANAWEDGDNIHLYACAFKRLDLNMLGDESGLKREEAAPFLSHYVPSTAEHACSCYPFLFLSQVTVICRAGRQS
uniref:carotenoid 9,10-dioxygenase n=1 Tax=Tetraselmis chuii TaxID=63592 RepID=A0A7S1X8S3_9CHLO|mmetsp:Transcript_5103/g.9273  ORF Transcript_5103/g.9273 Transcript_5103/m.9273 type:complete len:438 (+) Transcript_5103:84-1397(+)